MARNLPQPVGGAGTGLSCPVTTYTLRNASPAKTRADAVVVGIVQTTRGRGSPTGRRGRRARPTAASSQPLLATLGVTGKAGEVAKVPTGGTIKSPLLVLVGLGKEADADGGTPGGRRRRARGHQRRLGGASRCPRTPPSWCAR